MPSGPDAGCANMKMPGFAPSTPAVQEPAVLLTLAVLVELGGLLAEVPDVALASCEYQSVVRSSSLPRM